MKFELSLRSKVSPRASLGASHMDNQWHFAPVVLRQALTHGYMENRELALAHCESANQYTIVGAQKSGKRMSQSNVH